MVFKIVATPELKTQALQWEFGTRWLGKGYWLCVDPFDETYGYVEHGSTYGKEYIELKELNQDVLNQLVLLHSIGLSPKEIAEILNE